MTKPIETSPFITRIAEPDDPIYKEGWTITTRVWGRPPKPDPELAEAIREASNPSDKEEAHE